MTWCICRSGSNRKATEFSIYFLVWGKGSWKGVAKSHQDLALFIYFISSLMLSREVMIFRRPRAVFSQTESSDKDKCSWIYQELKLYGGERKKGNTEDSPFPNSNGWSPQYAWMLVSYLKDSVTLATTDPSCKALQEWFVTRPCQPALHRSRASWSYSVSCENSLPGLFCSKSLFLHPGIFSGFVAGASLKTASDNYNTNYSAELHKTEKNHFSLYKAQLR